MKKRIFAGIIIFTLFISLFAVQSQVKVAKAASKQQKEILKIVNKERTKRNRKKLVLSSKLNAAAQKRAKETAKLFSHTRPNGKSCFTVLKQYKIKVTLAGENIAAGRKKASDTMKDWMNSPGHKKNILLKKYKKMGVGYYKKPGSDYTYYWVQIFSN